MAERARWFGPSWPSRTRVARVELKLSSHLSRPHLLKQKMRPTLREVAFFIFAKFGGEGEIRTRETLSSLLAFQASGFNHSPTSPHG